MLRSLGKLIVIAFCLAGTGRSHAAEKGQISIDGQPRTYLLERAKASGPSPTIIMLHGANGTSERVAQISGLPQLAPQEGVTTVFPQSRANVWNRFLPGTDSPKAIELFRKFGGVPNDIGFLKMLTSDLVRRGIADRARIFIAGQSNGGFMTLAMFCFEGGLFAGVGLVVSSMLDQTGADCRSAKPLPIVIMNGTNDVDVPYGGGPVAPLDPNDKSPTPSVWSTRRMLTFFRDLNGCAEPVEQSIVWAQPTLSVDIERSMNCVGGPVVAYHVIGGTHTSTPAALPSGKVLLDFFRDRRR